MAAPHPCRCQNGLRGVGQALISLARSAREGRERHNVMADGQRIHRVIGRESDGTTRTQAEDFIEKARTEAAKAA
jgi:hypothetical protein